jgi:hypothetical protein
MSVAKSGANFPPILPHVASLMRATCYLLGEGESENREQPDHKLKHSRITLTLHPGYACCNELIRSNHELTPSIVLQRIEKWI